MAATWQNRALKEIFDRTLDITSGLKLMLVNSGYTSNPDNDFISSGGGGSASSNEFAGANYAGGFGGAGRKATTATFSEQDANDRAVVVLTNVTWTPLGGTPNDSIRGAILVKENTADSDSRMIAFFDWSNATDPNSNGSDVTINFDATNGNLRLNVISGMYNLALKEILDRTLDLTSGLKLMLVDNGYTFSPDHDTISQLSEITATNYTAGFGGAGRKAVSATFTEQDVNNRLVIILPNTTWTSLGGAVNDTVRAAVLVKEATNDADSRVIAYFEFTNVTDPSTNGSDFVLTFDPTNGNVRVNVV